MGTKLAATAMAVITAAVVGLTLPEGASAAPAGPVAKARTETASPRPLRILLTNDNGVDSPFLTGLRQALTAAGNDVTIVAPTHNVYGTGTSYTGSYGAVLKAQQTSPGVWAVDGTPADAVDFGVSTVFKNQLPDLVLAGVNAGQNTGLLVNHSGQLGAVVSALDVDIPAISVGDAVQLPNWQFPSAQQSIAFTVSLVERLAATAGDGPLLPDHVGLNVNYPVQANGRIAFTRIGRTSYVWTSGYQPASGQCPTCYTAMTDFPTQPDPVPNADTTALNEGYVSITPVSGDWGIPTAVSTGGVVGGLKDRLDGLRP
jgi:5'/3'-nucleotidase SurE